MTDQLHRALHDAVGDAAYDLAPTAVWDRGRRRRRRAVVATIGGLAVASVVTVVSVQAAVGSRRAEPAPTPATPSLAPTSPPSPSSVRSTEDGEHAITEAMVDEPLDPDTAASLPGYPDLVEMGDWASPEDATPLAEDPVERATVAVGFGLATEGRLPVARPVFVRGEDDRWREVDTTGLELGAGDASPYLGLSPGSLSPDGTRLAIGQEDGVVVIDLTTARRRAYDVGSLGPLWRGREVSWTADGSGVLMEPGIGDDDRRGWLVDVVDETVTRVPYEPSLSARLADGTVITPSGNGRELWSVAPDGTLTHLVDKRPNPWDVGALMVPSASGQRWVASRAAYTSGNGDPREQNGYLLLDELARPLRLLPVRGAGNGGGGGVLGWVDSSVVLLSRASATDPRYVLTVAWNVDTGELWRGPLVASNSVVSLPTRVT